MQHNSLGRVNKFLISTVHIHKDNCVNKEINRELIKGTSSDSTIEKLTTTTILGRQWQHKSTARELPHISTSKRQPYKSHSEGHFQQSTIHNIDNNDITTIRVLGMPQISWERSPVVRLSSLRFCDSDLGVHDFSKETDGRGWERIVFPGGVVGVTRALRVLCCTILQLLGSRNIIIIQGAH